MKSVWYCSEGYLCSGSYWELTCASTGETYSGGSDHNLRCPELCSSDSGYYGDCSTHNTSGSHYYCDTHGYVGTDYNCTYCSHGKAEPHAI